MTDNEIVKALECCKIDDCKSCPLSNYDGCKSLLFDGDIVLGLINRQKAEIEEKDIEIDILIKKKDAAYDEISELRAEVERLQNAYKQCAWERDTFLEETKTAKSEAIKEFASNLKESFRKNLILSSFVRNMVDNLVKEMVGEKDV